MKVLVVAPNWIGDVLMAEPLLRAVKSQAGVELTVLAPAWVAPVLHAMPEVDAVISADLHHGRLQPGLRRQIAAQLRAQNFQRAIILPNSLKSALIPWLARIPERIGYRAEGRAILLTRALERPAQNVPMVEHYLRLASGAAPAAPAQGKPSLVVPIERSTRVLERFRLSGHLPIIALCPGAEYGPAKRWPAAHFAALADRLHAADASRQIILLGSASDLAVSREIAALTGAPVRVLAGETGLDEAIALLAACTAVVSNDSGLMHISAALGRPQVALFGSSDPRHTPPLSAQAQVLWLHLECSPCFKRECPLGHLNCLKQITPEQVATALDTATAS